MDFVLQMKTTTIGKNKMSVFDSLESRLEVVFKIDYYTRRAVENKEIKPGDESQFRSDTGEMFTLSLKRYGFIAQRISLVYFKESRKGLLVTRDFGVTKDAKLEFQDKACIEYELDNLKYVEFDSKEANKVLRPAKKSNCSGAEEYSFSCSTISELADEMSKNGSVLMFTADSNLQSGAKFLLAVNPGDFGSIYLESPNGETTLETSRIINTVIDLEALK